MNSSGFGVQPEALVEASKGPLANIIEDRRTKVHELLEIKDLLEDAIGGGRNAGFYADFDCAVVALKDSEQGMVRSLTAFQAKVEGAAHKYQLMESETTADVQDVSRRLEGE